MHKIIDFLIQNKDEQYAEFSKKLIPDTKHPIIGVRTPKLKQLAKEISKNKELFNSFIHQKHTYHEEFLLHGLLLGEYKDNISNLLAFLFEFIPHIDNWAVCDLTVSALKIIKKFRNEVFLKITELTNSNHPYSIRFAIVTLLWYFLDKDYIDRSLSIVEKLTTTNEYYVNMAIAWFYSIAIIKDYNKAIIYLEDRKLPKFIHNKTIQKCNESYRISQQVKLYLKTLKI